MGEVKTFGLFIWHQGLALYLLFLPQGRRLEVAFVRFYNQNENVMLLILYMACVSGIVSSHTLMVFCTFFNSCLATLSCWSQCCSLSAVLGAAACAVSVISVL